MDFFTPIVDDPYSYGAIAAANSLSDVYAMGGKPITAMNIACFDPSLAPPEVWAAIFRGISDKCAEAEVALVGGHSVEDKQPKFGLSVTGIVSPSRMFYNAAAAAGDNIYLSKPLGTGIVTTAAKFDDCPDESLSAAIESMSRLNKSAAEAAHAANAKCATDITGFGLAGHLFNIARASCVRVVVDSEALPLLPGAIEMALRGNTTAGANNNRDFMGGSLVFESREEWVKHLAVDPQTSGGLAIFCKEVISEYPKIGFVEVGEPAVILR